MADSIVKLRIDSKEYDANIKRAGQVLSEYMAKVREGGGTFAKLDDGVMDAVRSLGEMSTKADNSRGGLRELQQAITDLTIEYRLLSDEEKSTDFGRELSASLRDLTDRAGVMRDAMIDTQATISHAASDTRTFDELASGAQLATAGFQTMRGAMSVLGVEMGDNVALIAKLQSAMSVTNGLTQIQNQLQRESAVVQGVLSVQGRAAAIAQDLLAKNTAAASAAQRVFNAVAKANPYVLLAGAIGAVVGAFALFSSSAKDAATDSRNTTKAIDDMTDAANRWIGMMERLGASESAINEMSLNSARQILDRATKERVAIQEELTRLSRSGSIDDIARVKDLSEKLEDARSAEKKAMEAVSAAYSAQRDAAKFRQYINDSWDTLDTEKSIQSAIREFTRLRSEVRKGSQMWDEYTRRIDILNGKLGKSGSDNSLPGAKVGGGRSVADGHGAVSDAVVFPEGSAARLNEELKELQKLQSLVTSSGDWQDYERDIDAVCDRIHILKGELPSGKEAVFNINLPSQEVIDRLKEISDIRFSEELVDGVSLVVSADTQDAMRAVQSLTAGIAGTSVVLKVKAVADDDSVSVDRIKNSAGLSEYINELKDELNHTNFGDVLYDKLSSDLADMSTLQTLVEESLSLGLGTAMFDVADELGRDFWTRALEGGVDDIDWDSIIAKINEARKEAGLDTIEIDFKTGKSKSKGGGEDKEVDKSLTEVMGQLGGGMNQLTSGLEQLGIDVPEGLKNVTNSIQGVVGVLTAIASIVHAISLIVAVKSLLPGFHGGGIVPGFSGGGIVPGFSGGGIVDSSPAKLSIPLIGRAALGMSIPGGNFSGDNMRLPVDGGRGMIGVNSGELILNRSEQGIIADALSRDAGAVMQPYVDGESIFLGMNNTSKRMGRGEIVTTETLRRMGISRR